MRLNSNKKTSLILEATQSDMRTAAATDSCYFRSDGAAVKNGHLLALLHFPRI